MVQGEGRWWKMLKAVEGGRRWWKVVEDVEKKKDRGTWQREREALRQRGIDAFRR